MTEGLTINTFMEAIKAHANKIRYWPWSCPEAIQLEMRHEAFRLVMWVPFKDRNGCLEKAHLYTFYQMYR